MSLYTPQRSRNLFTKEQGKPFKLSRSKIQDFLNCPCCFYLDRKCGTGQPPGFPFTLNSAVDTLLKKEFDSYRTEGKPHPLLIQNGIDAIPFVHPELDEWRQNFKGLQYTHEPTDFIVTGAIDDLWINPDGELIVVDYKATSTTKTITLDEEYRQSYKNQMEIYQWLLRMKGFRISNTGYFVYCNGDSSKESFGGKLEFSISILPYNGDDSWVESTLFTIRECLEGTQCPEGKGSCNFCNYRAAVQKHLQNQE
ncbi:MAG: PD-(D/E)XK nuclease family protein [Rhabdochlamydiaceae bacterium]